MITVVITKQDFMNAYDAHGERLRLFIQQFTRDRARVEKILDGAIWSILTEAIRGMKARTALPMHRLVPLAAMLRLTRRVALDHLQQDPLYDPWAPFELEPAFFPLNDPTLTEFHRNIFYLRYYRDISESDIAERYRTTEEDVNTRLRDTLKSMHATMKAGKI